MKIFLIIVLFLLVSAAFVYALMPYEEGSSAEFDNRELSQIRDEKQDIIKNTAQIREEREKNLHPFVQIAAFGTESSFDDNIRTNTAMEQEEKTLYVKTPLYDPKPGSGINFMAISVILSGFLLAYFFIHPKSK